jgi:hypothetical protein
MELNTLLRSLGYSGREAKRLLDNSQVVLTSKNVLYIGTKWNKEGVAVKYGRAVVFDKDFNIEIDWDLRKWSPKLVNQREEESKRRWDWFERQIDYGN